MRAELPSSTQLIADGVVDAELCALLWLLTERGVPLVVAARETPPGEALRAAFSALAGKMAAADDGAIPGGTVVADSLEDVLRLAGTKPGSAGVDDEVRDLGVVCVLKQAAVAVGFLVASAHYVRPVERDAAGHLQRRPPALLSAWDEQAHRFDHFFWAITDELATRAGLDPSEFDTMYRRRAAFLNDLVQAGVFKREHVRRHIERAALVEAQMGTLGANAPN